MSKEIKLRTWSELYKQWCGGTNYVDGVWLGWICRYGKDIMTQDIILEQYTGLKDKNGKEIYEGDIFRNTINGGTWRVYWNEEDASFWVDSGVAGCSLGEFDWDRSEKEHGFIRRNCEIIGNIHENPELLGGEE